MRLSLRPGLRWVPLLTMAVLVGPVLAGLAGVIAPAFGWYPALGGTDLSLASWRALFDWPGLPAATRLSVTTALGSTLLSLAITVLIFAAWQGTRAFALIERALSPLLAIPHAAAALGLAFLIAPSGWIARLFSPWATGWEVPPDLLITQDALGLALIAGLVVKEVPFLMLMTLAALAQVPARRSVLIAQSQGYGRVSAWVKTVFPQIYPQIRLPVYAVLTYAASVVDVALILGPTTPSTLSVQVMIWLGSPDLSLRFQAAAGALLQCGLVLMVLALWRAGEWLAGVFGLDWIMRGGRGRRDGPLRGGAFTLAGGIAAAVFLGLAGLALWSFAGLWGFPQPWPDTLSLRSWERSATSLGALTRETMLIAGAATGIALVLVLACLEAETRHAITPGRRALWLLYLPILVPQATFLTGLQTLAIGTGLHGMTMSVVAAHVVFVLPYVFLSLADPFRAWDPRYALVAQTLGAGPERILWRIRLPMLLRAVLTAAAVGFAVSVGQYLPTLLIGMGRVSTLTTEAVALASGGDRRLIGVYAIAQTAVALLGFLLALTLPRIAFRNRQGLAVGHG